MKKKLIAAAALVVVVVALIIAGVKITEHRKVTNDYTEPAPPENAVPLYGDLNPDQDDNIAVLKDGNVMLEKVKAEVEGLKDNGFSDTALTLQEEKTEKETRFRILSDKEATDIYFVFTESGPAVITSSKKDDPLYSLCCAALLYACTPSVGDFAQCQAVFAEMEKAIADGGTAVTYTQNYTEYTYKPDKSGKTFSAREAEVVG